MSSIPPNALAGAMGRIGGVAPVNLLDVLDMHGYSYHWASMPIASAAVLGIAPVFTGTAPEWNAHLRIADWDDTYLAWLTHAGPFHLSRSMQSQMGSFAVQNVSGDTLNRDMAQLIKASAFEGALFAFREWNLEAGTVEFEMHGHLTIESVSESVAEFGCDQLINPSDYQGLMMISETCAWRYASAACGDTTDNPCQNSWLTCRQPSRYAGFVANLVAISPEGAADVSTRNVVRNRQV